MVTTVEQLAEQAVNLRPNPALADLLVESLDAAELGPIDRRDGGSKRRRDEVRSGRVETIAGEESSQKVRDVVRR